LSDAKSAFPATQRNPWQITSQKLSRVMAIKPLCRHKTVLSALRAGTVGLTNAPPKRIRGGRPQRPAAANLVLYGARATTVGALLHARLAPKTCLRRFVAFSAFRTLPRRSSSSMSRSARLRTFRWNWPSLVLKLAIISTPNYYLLEKAIRRPNRVGRPKPCNANANI